MRFLDYAKQRVGGNFVVARCTAKNLQRYPNHAFVTRTRFEQIKQDFYKAYPEDAKAYFEAGKCDS